MLIALTGQRDLYRWAHQLHAAGHTGLKRELDRASRRAGRIVEAAIKEDPERYIPAGYEVRFRQNLETKTEVQLLRGRRITVVVGARGKVGRRHVKQMNEGDLRHPVFGRNRRLKDGSLKANPWVTQRIKPGLVDEPGMRAMPAAKQEISEALGRVAAKLGKAGPA